MKLKTHVSKHAKEVMQVMKQEKQGQPVNDTREFHVKTQTKLGWC